MIKKIVGRKIKVIIVVGARPNFMKAAPLLKAMCAHGKFDVQLLHTGQHYDLLMSDAFFRDLDMPKPDISLGIGSGTQAEQTAKIMLAIEAPFAGSTQERPDLVVVVGDVNSTLAATLTAKKLQIPVAHVEAGLRSFDEAMPEEINRVLTDHISDFLFTTEPAGNENLRHEHISPQKIHYVGNIMIDSLVHHEGKIDKSNILTSLNLLPKRYALLTLHRPSNVDNKETLQKIFSLLEEIGSRIPIIFPIHPRTRKQMGDFGIVFSPKNIHLIDPLGYIDFLKLVKQAAFVMTDSGGLQEETTFLNVPCITLRKNTERPITVELGTNIIVGDDRATLFNEVEKILSGNGKQGTIPQYWDGKVSHRITEILIRAFYE